MWRRVLAALHPDRGGCPDLFVWASPVREHVAGDGPEDSFASTAYQRRQPPPHRTAGERIDFAGAYAVAGFDELTRRAIRLGDEAGEPFASLLRLLHDCAESFEPRLSRQEQQGATYKTLAAIAYSAGFTAEDRSRWYKVAASVPLSQRHAGHIMARLKSREAA